MEYNVNKKEIILDRNLNNLDKFVLNFIKCIDNYVIVSGYVSILLGRTRATEDVDLLIPKMSKGDFVKIWEKIINKGFWCINTSDANQAYEMLKEHAVRFAEIKKPIPNIEFKFIKNELDEFSYKHKIKVILNLDSFYISPLELQIAYKLFLGSEKDIEDARHLYSLFKDKINKSELINSLEKLKVSNKFKLLENGKH
jgi:hypothetical protein